MDLLVRAAFKVVPLELAMPNIFWFVFSEWSPLNVSRLIIFHWDPKSHRETKPCYCVRRRRTLPNFMGLLWTLVKALRVFWAFYRAGSYDVTFSLRKGFCLVWHTILSSSRTSGVGGRVVEEFRSCCCFRGKLFSQYWIISEPKRYFMCDKRSEIWKPLALAARGWIINN